MNGMMTGIGGCGTAMNGTTAGGCMTVMAGRTAVIIGGGMGGLITGALLSRLGCRVTVLEKNSNVGGGLQTFRRAGAEFSPGMHLVGGRDGGAAVALLRMIGVDVRLKSCPMTTVLQGVMPEKGGSCADSTAGRSFEQFSIPQGTEAFYNCFAARFPGSAAQLRRYLDRMQEICDSVPLLRTGSAASAHSEECGLTAMFDEDRQLSYFPDGDALMPADEFVAKYISDPRLRTVLGWLNPLTGSIPGVTPAYVHAIINVLYISGSSQFAGGTKPIARQLVRIIESSGGEVKAGCAATGILVGKDVSGCGLPEVRALNGTHGFARGVQASDGNLYTADTYISAINPSALAALCPQDAFPKVFRRRLAAQKPGISMFCLYIKLKDDVQAKADGIVDSRGTDAFGVAKFILDGGFGCEWQPWGEILYVRDGNAVTLMAPMSCEEVSRWKGTAHGHRPKEYGRWLAERTEQLLERIEWSEPGFRSRIEACWSASPLTFSDFLGDPDGAVYGFRIDSSSPAYSRFGPKTYLRNLYMTGQNAGLHGLCGVSMSSVLTVRAILDDVKSFNAIG